MKGRRARGTVLALAGLFSCALLGLWRCSPSPNHGEPEQPGSGGAAGGAAGAGGARPEDACEEALPLRLRREGASWFASAVGTLSGAVTRVGTPHGNCVDAGNGPTRYLTLDTSELPDPVELTALVDADFDALLAVEQGRCGDPDVLACDRGAAQGRDDSRVQVTISPGVHTLRLSGVADAGDGNFRLDLMAMALEEECESAPAHVGCAEPKPLDPRLELQTILADARCAPREQSRPSLFYSLDLRDESEPARILIWAEAVKTSAVERFPRVQIYSREHDEIPYVSYDKATGCGNVVAETEGFSEEVFTPALLEPGYYVIRIHATEPWYGTVRVRLATSAHCTAPLHDRCSDAEPLDVTTGFVEVEGSTLCNHDDYSLPLCNEESAPDRVYRIDLSHRAGPVRVRARMTTTVEFGSLLVLTREQDAGCGAPVYCRDTVARAEGPGNIDTVVSPGVYFLVVDGALHEAAGRFKFQLHISEELLPSSYSCYGDDIDWCVTDNDVAWNYCATEPTAPSCAASAVACGLDPAVQACVCDAEPGCCSGEKGASECATLFCDCEYFCRYFRDAPILCGDSPELADGVVP